MIKVNKRGDKITIKGHSLPHVCAATSSVMYTSVNALLKYDKQSILFHDGQDDALVPNDDVEIKVLKHDKIIDMLVRNMIRMFKDIEEDYPDCISVK